MAEILSDDIKTGGPAFPISIPGCGDNGAFGMTLRDWFAGQALAGVIGPCVHDSTKPEQTIAELFAERDEAETALRIVTCV
jgi:hypothetical protein